MHACTAHEEQLEANQRLSVARRRGGRPPARSIGRPGPSRNQARFLCLSAEGVKRVVALVGGGPLGARGSRGRWRPAPEIPSLVGIPVFQWCCSWQWPILSVALDLLDPVLCMYGLVNLLDPVCAKNLQCYHVLLIRVDLGMVWTQTSILDQFSYWTLLVWIKWAEFLM